MADADQRDLQDPSDAARRFSELRDRATSTFGDVARLMRGDLKLIARLLDSQERVLALAYGRLQGRGRMAGQLLTATDRRVLLTQRRTPLGRDWVTEIGWDAIRSASVHGPAGVLTTVDDTWVMDKAMPLSAFTTIERVRGDGSTGAGAGLVVTAATPHGPAATPLDDGPLARSPITDRTVEDGPDDEVVHRTVIDGVPVHWCERPGRLEADLLFGVGMRDEPFVRTGITHLVEHLAMQPFTRVPYACNASVHPRLTSFEVASSPDVVVRHLEQVCRSLAALDLGVLERERAVLLAEESGSNIGVFGWLPPTIRFGSQGLGLLGNVQIAPHLATAEDVEAWGRRWFHRGNAVLVLSGPPPAGLRLPLPDAPGDWVPDAHATVENLPVVATPTPSVTEGPPDSILLTVAAGWTPAFAAGWSVLVDRLLRRLRHDLGLIYELVSSIEPVAGERVLATVAAEGPEAQAQRLADEAWRVVTELRDHGVTDAELDHQRAILREERHHPEVLAAGATDQAIRELVGSALSLGRDPSATDRLHRDDVSAALRAALPTLVVAVPSGVAVPDLPRLDQSGGALVDGTTYDRARLGSAMPRGSRLIAGPDGLSVRTGHDDDTWATVRYPGVVGLKLEQVGPGDEMLLLMAGSGVSVVFRAKDWRGAAEVEAAIRRAVPAHLHYRLPG
ncbi:insulinase family protein [Nakamurella leprariae]|uniref:Insulinase family protein n=1 Tax=Nakamurella leprariae TaxID=2803911 RepID=A0A939C362_9ACTN|nr:insulinase family protein [Nakamurella leprariae]MBM9469059.1 insulinase family protein [Nakamurella leprariae]